MKCITAEQSKEWWNQHYRFSALAPECREWPAGEVVKLHIAFDKAPISQLHFLGRGFVGWVTETISDRMLVWVDEYGIWEDPRDLALYYLLRTSHGDHAHLEDGPGHVFCFHEQVGAQSLVSLAISCGWGFYCASSHGDRAIRLDHHGHVFAWANHEAVRATLTDWLGRFSQG